MKISIRKVTTICQLKWQLILRNMSVMVAPILPILFVLILKPVMKDAGNGANGISGGSFILGFGLIFSVVMGGIMMGSYPLAEEKEKHTLRVLMTSSVNGTEYFLGSVLPPLVILIIVNMIIVPLSGNSFQKINIGSFLGITIVTTIISLIIGYLIGMVAKNQMQAGMISLPALLGFTMIPMFRVFSKPFRQVSEYLYSGVVTKYVDQTVAAGGYQWNLKDSLVLLGWLVVSLAVFIYAYRRNGLDND